MSKNDRENESLFGGLADDLTGRESFKRSKWGFFSGFSAARGAAGDVKGLFGESMGRTRGLVDQARRGGRQGAVISPEIQGARERFEASMYANGRSDGDVEKAVRATHNQFWMYAAFLVVAAAVCTWFLISSGLFIGGGFAPIEILIRYFPIPIIAMMLFTSGYVNWMYRNRLLGGWRDYVMSGALLPRKNSDRLRSQSIRTLPSLLMIAVLLAASLPGVALAQALPQTTGLPETVRNIFDMSDMSDDMFMRVLSYVIPGVGPVPSNEYVDSNQYQALRNGFFAFSSALLFIGSVIFGWQLLSSVVASAKEGSLLGRKYHEVWAPVRLVIGFGMLAPLANGLCAAQLIVLFVVAFGSNLANAVWTPYIETITLTSTRTSQESAISTINASNLPQSMKIVEQVFAKELCNEILKTYASRNSTPGNGSYVDTPQWAAYQPQSGQAEAWNVWTDNNIRFRSLYNYWAIDYGPHCGTIRVTSSSDGAVNLDLDSLVTGGNLDGSRAGGAGSLDLASYQAGQITSKAQRDGVDAVINHVRRWAVLGAQSYQDVDTPVMRLFSKDTSSEVNTQMMESIAKARDDYMTIMLASARDIYNATNPYHDGESKGKLEQIREAAVKGGWAASGTFYVSLARLQNAIYERSTDAPTFDNVNFTNLSNVSRDLEEYVIGGVNSPGTFTQFTSWYTGAMKDSDMFPMEAMTAANDEVTTLGKGLTAIFGSAVSIWEHDTDPHPLNPMQDMIDMGNKFIGTGVAALVTSTGFTAAAGATDAAGNVASNIPVVGGIFKALGSSAAQFAGAIGSVAFFFAVAFILVGIVHAFVIPMIPYIMTVFFVGSMVILVAEALVAAPIWAFMHIRMDGDEFVDGVQKPGYMIVFNLLLRPTLMIFGLILSYVVFAATSLFIAETFTPAMYGLGSSNSIGFFGMVTMIALVTYLHFLTAIRAFSLVTRLPDRVTRWFGQGGENLGEESDSDKVTAFVYGSERRVDGLVKPMALMGAKKGAADQVAKSITEASGKGTGGGKGGGHPTGV